MQDNPHYAKYNAYKVPQLEMLFKNKNIAEEKKQVIQFILIERGVMKAPEAPAESAAVPVVEVPAAEKTPVAEAPAAETAEQPKANDTKTTETSAAAAPAVEKPAATKKPKEKKKRKATDKTRDTKTDWAFEVGDEVKVQIAKNAKVDPGKIIDGKIIKRREWEGFKEYVVKTELRTFTKRQSSLLKSNNKQAAPATEAPAAEATA